MRFCFACRALTGAVSWTTFCISTWRPCCPAQSVDTWAKRTSKHPSTPSEIYSKSLRGSWSNVWVSQLIYLRSFRSCAQAAAPVRARAKKGVRLRTSSDVASCALQNTKRFSPVKASYQWNSGYNVLVTRTVLWQPSPATASFVQ